MTTAACSSAITELDGDAGILRYRGYPIEQLAEHSTYLEVAYLLIHGELPDAEQFDAWRHQITYHTFIHENMRKRFMDGFHYDAHPMGMLVSGVAALSTFYPDAKDLDDPDIRYKQIVRLIAKMPTIAACSYRFSEGMPFVWPDNTKGFTENFLKMMFEPWEHVPLAGPGPRPGARHPLHPPRRPRAELLHHGDAGRRLVARRPVHLDGGRHRRAVRAPPRRRQRGRSSTCSPRSGRSTTSTPS